MKSVYRLFLAALFFLLCCLPVAFGVEYRTSSVDVGSFLGDGDLRMIVFSEDDYDLKVLDNRSMDKPRHNDLKSAVAHIDGIAGINGGFFAREGYPLGLVYEGGKRYGSFASKSSLVSGIYFLSNGGPQLMRSKVFGKHRKKLVNLSDAVQGGPFLVEDSKPVRGLSDEKRRNRTFIMTDQKGKWAIGTCEGVSLARLAKILSDPDQVNGFKATRAMNLDGGTSSALVWRGRWKMKNGKKVRNYLVLKAK